MTSSYFSQVELRATKLSYWAAGMKVAKEAFKNIAHI